MPGKELCHYLFNLLILFLKIIKTPPKPQELGTWNFEKIFDPPPQCYMSPVHKCFKCWWLTLAKQKVSPNLLYLALLILACLNVFVTWCSIIKELLQQCEFFRGPLPIHFCLLSGASQSKAAKQLCVMCPLLRAMCHMSCVKCKKKYSLDKGIHHIFLWFDCFGHVKCWFPAGGLC